MRFTNNWLFPLFVLEAAIALLIPADAYAERILLFKRPHFVGPSEVLSSQQRYYGSNSQIGPASSAKVISGRWLLCDGSNFSGNCIWTSRDISSFTLLSPGSTLASLRPWRVPILQRDWGGRHPPSREDLVFFENKDFRGKWTSLKEGVADMSTTKIDPRPGSVVVQRRVWRICERRNFGGACVTLASSAWDLDEIFGAGILSAEPVSSE